MAKKQGERAHKATEAAIESGMLSRKTLAEARRREARATDKAADRGLLEAGNFRKGTLHVKKGIIAPPVISKRPKQRKKASGSKGKSKKNGKR